MRAFNPTFQASMATGRGAKPIDAAQASLRELCSVLESSYIAVREVYGEVYGRCTEGVRKVYGSCKTQK